MLQKSIPNTPVERKKALTLGRRNGKNLGNATGDRTHGHWFCAPVLWPLSYHAAAANYAEYSTLKRLPTSALRCWATAMLQSTANSGRHHEMLCGFLSFDWCVANELIDIINPVRISLLIWRDIRQKLEPTICSERKGVQKKLMHK